jgi:hypothetical protein
MTIEDNLKGFQVIGLIHNNEKELIKEIQAITQVHMIALRSQELAENERVSDSIPLTRINDFKRVGIIQKIKAKLNKHL